MPTLSAPPVPGGAASSTPHRLARTERGRLVLSRYPDDRGQRTVCARRGPQGSVLVLDEDPAMLDRRLVAHLLADEPAGNALLVARQYATDPRRRARALCDLDWIIAPEPEPIALDAERELTDAAGTRYRLASTTRDGVRWTRLGVGEDRATPIALRAVVGALQDYEPARCMTRAALATAEQTARLAVELDELAHSPRVLNRRLRERVLGRVARGEDTLSHIALRCGRRKMRSDFAGHVGDTAWLRRRIGDAPEAGKTRPSAWIHHELLGRIARDGLGVDPHEVELA